MLGFWGLLLAAPLLAVIFAYRAIGEEDVPRRLPPRACRIRRRRGRKLPEVVLLLPEEPGEITTNGPDAF